MADSVTPLDSNTDISAITDKAELLALLHDVQVPQVSAWPAPGWWVLGFLFIAWLVAIMLNKKRQRVYAQNAWRREALDKLSDIETRLPSADDEQRHQLVKEVSSLLRRVMMQASGRSQVAGLTADAWLNELNAINSDTQLDASLHRLLTDIPYQTVPNALTTSDNVASLVLWMRQTIHRLPSQHLGTNDRVLIRAGAAT